MDRKNDNIGMYKQILKELANVAQEASLTGMLEGGEVRAARRYNAVLKTLESDGIVPQGLFEPLTEDSGYGSIGMECRMLLSVLNGKSGDCDARKKVGFGWQILTRLAPFVDRDTLSEMAKATHLIHGVASPEILTQLAPFMDRDDLGDVVRMVAKSGVGFSPELLTQLAPFLDKDDLGDILRESMRVEAGVDLSEAPVPPIPPVPQIIPTEPEGKEEFMEPSRQDSWMLARARTAELVALAQELTNPDLSAERRVELAHRLQDLSVEQVFEERERS